MASSSSAPFETSTTVIHPSGRDAQQRGWRAIDEIVEAGHRCPAVVAHGNLISLILRRIEPEIGFEFWRRLSNPDVYVLARDDESAWTSERVWNPGGSATEADHQS